MIHEFLLPALAGFIAGAMNAVVGGGSFVSLAALVGLGLPSVSANETSTVALFFGQISSSWAVRDGLRPVAGVPIMRMLPATIIGGFVGALALMATPDLVLDQILPWLLLFAAIALLAGRQTSAALRRHGVHIGVGAILPAQFVLGVYGGYFGGAVGIIMAAVWLLLDQADLRAMMPMRTLMVSAANATAVLMFATLGQVHWPAAISMAITAGAGGYLGAHYGRRLPNIVLKSVTIAVTLAMTLYFFHRAGTL